MVQDGVLTATIVNRNVSTGDCRLHVSGTNTEPNFTGIGKWKLTDDFKDSDFTF